MLLQHKQFTFDDYRKKNVSAYMGSTIYLSFHDKHGIYHLSWSSTKGMIAITATT
jgi:hypothetical protein